MIINNGDTISFIYNKRLVKCIVTFIDDDLIFGLLKTDYIGKNENWYIGETKKFKRNLIKDIYKFN